MDILKGYVSATDAAEIIGVSHSQLTRYVSSGLLPAVRIGGQIFIRRAKCQRFKRPKRGNPQFSQK